MLKKILLCFTVAALFTAQSYGQKKDVSQMTRSEILSMSYDELAEMPIEDVMQLELLLP